MRANPGKPAATVESEAPEGVLLGKLGKAADKKIPGFVDRVAKLPESVAKDDYVRYAGESHLMSFGYTGSGKTTGPAISNGLVHPGQFFAIDCKGDIYRATAEQRRRMGQEVVVLDLTGPNPESGSFNFMDGIRQFGGEQTVIARTTAAACITRVAPIHEFWDNTSESLLTATIGGVMDVHPPEQQNFSAVYDLLNGEDVIYACAAFLDTHGKKLSRSTYNGLAGFLGLSERDTRPSVLASAQQHLQLWESDFIRGLTDRTSFDLQGFIDGKPMSIYIIVPPVRMAAYAPLIRLWLIGLLTALMTRKSMPRHKTLMICDEVAALGRMEAMVTASTLLRSFGVQLWSFWQNPAQLEIYQHHARTLVDNAGVLQLLGARNLRMAAEFASLAGGITAEEILEIGNDECIVLVDGGKPQRIRKVRYFDEPDLAPLAGVPKRSR